MMKSRLPSARRKLPKNRIDEKSSWCASQRANCGTGVMTKADINKEKNQSLLKSPFIFRKGSLIFQRINLQMSLTRSKKSASFIRSKKNSSYQANFSGPSTGGIGIQEVTHRRLYDMVCQIRARSFFMVVAWFIPIQPIRHYAAYWSLRRLVELITRKWRYAWRDTHIKVRNGAEILFRSSDRPVL